VKVNVADPDLEYDDECENIDANGNPISPECAFNKLLPTDTLTSVSKPWKYILIDGNKLTASECFTCADYIYDFYNEANSIQTTGNWMCEMDDSSSGTPYTCLYEMDSTISATSSL